VIKRLNKEFKAKNRGKRTMIIDSTDIQFDINLEKRYYTEEKLKEKGFKIGFSSSKGYYIGGKLTLSIDKDTCQPLAMLFHPGAVPDTEIYLEMLEELKKRRILRHEDLIIADKGYYSYDNYEISVLKYKIIPLIYPKKNMRKEKVLCRFCYPLECFSTKKHEKPIYRRIVSKFSALIDKWKNFKNTRSLIEDFNKFMKNGVGYTKIPVVTYKSAAKNTFLSVLLAGLIISKLTPHNKTLQSLAEM
jgi:hypothetical protein